MTSENQTRMLPEGKTLLFRSPDSGDVMKERVYHETGTRLSLSVLRRLMLSDIVAQDTGAIIVQTRSEDGNRQSYVFDAHHMLKPGKDGGRSELVELDKLAVNDPVYDITIGKPWNSPLGPTDRVVGVATPDISGYSAEMAASARDGTAPVILGRQALDAALD